MSARGPFQESYRFCSAEMNQSFENDTAEITYGTAKNYILCGSLGSIFPMMYYANTVVKKIYAVKAA